MRLTSSRIAELLAGAADLADIPDEAAVLLEGSIAEGFGNARSDVDFLVVTAGDDAMPTMPTVLFVDGARVEIRTRSTRQLQDQLNRVAAGDLDEDVLNRVQRFLRARLIRASTEVDSDRLQESLDYPVFCAIVADWWARRARHVLRWASAQRLLGESDDAAAWARDGVTQQFKSWAALRGETYLESKWLPQQLDRIGADEPLVSAYREWHDHGSRDPHEALDAAVDLAVRAGATAEFDDPSAIRLRRVPDITTWPIRDRLHIVRDRADVFVLSDDAAAVWRQVVFRRPLNDVASAPISGAKPALAEFIRLGLVGLSWQGSPIVPALAMCEPPRPYTPPPTVASPALGIRGCPRNPDAVATLSSLPATRFAECALTLIWANIVAENAWEDLDGAIRDQQWRVADIAAHRMVALCVRVLLSTFGIHPLPADIAPVPTARRLLPATAPDRDALIETLDSVRDLRFDDTVDAPAIQRRLRGLAQSVRAVADGQTFPESFESRESWRDTLAVSYDWLRIGGYLNASLPIDEARDLLESGGAQPHLAAEEQPQPAGVR